ncbi:MAG TPA: cation:proton antiporter [Pseudomonadales bacterium]|nr:cation:proton antiporter [Pseudomonadales bacterium]
MIETLDVNALIVALVGGLVLMASLAASLCARLGIPSLVGYMLLGIVVRVIDVPFGLLSEQVMHAVRLLADLGIVALLFAVGIESHPRALAEKLPAALPIWLGNVVVSGLLGFVVVFYLLELGLVPALVCATALTATSVGVAMAMWRDAGRLDSPDGRLLVDVAELDDLSAVAMMALLFAALPALLAGNAMDWDLLAAELVGFLLRFAAFLVACLAFAHFAEHRVTAFAARLHLPPERMLVVAGFGFLIAALAGLMGFSLAVGALFAGLLFSRDPEAVKTEASFQDLYAFVTPFFFIAIGLAVEPSHLLAAVPLALVLVGVAVVGKLVGTILPALFVTSASAALLLGVSMVPRAEIALVLFDQARILVPEVMGPDIYSAAVLMTALLCAGTPLLLAPLLRRWPRAGR